MKFRDNVKNNLNQIRNWRIGDIFLSDIYQLIYFRKLWYFSL